MEKLQLLLDAGIGFTIVASYVLYKLKTVKKRLRSTILRRAS